MLIDAINNYNTMLSNVKSEPEPMEQIIESNNPLEIIIKPELIDTSNLSIDDTNDYLWRPSTFDEYIGQTNLTNIIQARINGCKQRNKTFPHMLIDGTAGTGKTTIALLTAKYLNVPLVERIANTIQSQQQFVDLLIEAQGGVLFVDEIHEIKSKVANFILPLLEDFKINGQRIKPFTFFGATTELGTLIKKFKPLVDRMKLQNTLDPYTTDEIKLLIKQFKNKQYSDEIIDEEVYNKISKNCRLVPRIAIKLLENYIFMNKNIDEVLKTDGIVINSLTKDDIKVLRLLKEHNKGVGLKAISSYLCTSELNYLYKYEQYLLQQGYITITNRRQITEKGINLLQYINK